jgi:hypothetical protein
MRVDTAVGLVDIDVEEEPMTAARALTRALMSVYISYHIRTHSILGICLEIAPDANMTAACVDVISSGLI